MAYRVGCFLLACVVGLGIVFLVTLPLIVAAWYLLKYAAAQ